MLRRNKKGIEIAINTVVVLVLGIVMLGAGITLVVKFLDKGTELKEGIDEALAQRIREQEFRDGRAQGVSPAHMEIERGEPTYILLGILNKEDNNRKFRIFTEYSTKSPIDSKVQLLPPALKSKITPNNAFFLHQSSGTSANTFELEINEEHFSWLRFEIPKDYPTGQYLFDVYVCYDGTSQTSGTPCSSSSTRTLYTGQKMRLFITVK